MEKWQRIKYHPNTPIGNNGQKVTACKEHIELSKNAAKEGMVLLKNTYDILPIKKGEKVALFGKGSYDYVKGGGGSGDVTVEYTTNIYEGMKQLEDHVSVFEEVSTCYRKYVNNQYDLGKEPGMIKEPDLPDELLEKASRYADIAVISISRFSGEGWDRKSTYDKNREHENEPDKESANSTDEIFERGDFYLTDAEEQMVEKVKARFEKVVAVLNVGGVIDTEWFAADDAIQSVLLAWQGGIEGGLAAAELLCGIGNPSGKLADTFVKKLEDYPSSYNFHESDDYVEYTEDIYVGYRYFETIPQVKDRVNYPFGFGLSYTKFCWDVVSVNSNDNKINIAVKVTNIGEISGKEVIQVYACPPQGLLGKAAKNLVAFKKTRLLSGGDSQLVFIKFEVDAMASYDDLGKLHKSSYVMEAGEYNFFVGTSVRDSKKIDFTYEIDADRVVQQLSEKIAPTSLTKRMLSDGSYEELLQRDEVDTDASVLNHMLPKETEGIAPLIRYSKRYHIYETSNKKTKLIEVVEGKLSLDEFIYQVSDDDLAHILGGQPNVGSANTFGLGNMPEYGIPNVMTADGPAGLRIAPECGVNTTAWPCSTMLACTWNEDIVFAVGEAGAKEVRENNLGVWLTPAVNIHRSPLCGRNFEYYSEDPLLAGKLASAMVKGIQSQGIGATVKHFALNNKETNRKDSDSRVSERAAREIYLKAFEIIVKEAHPWCIMSSYNIINGYRASENRELLTDILREEWGFDGMVTTDWWTYGEHYKEVKAGNDLKMGCGYPERLLEAKEKGAITREEFVICARRILEFIIKLN